MLGTAVTLVEGSRLTKLFGEQAAVTSLSLSIGAGEIVSLLGPNGAGKSTTLRMLLGLLRPTEGTVRLAGHDPFEQHDSAMKLVGYVPDEPVFWDYLKGGDTIRFVGEMRGMSPDQIERAARPLIERFDMTAAMADLPASYSHGMRKKLALILALLHDPPILVLDEPNSGLDPIANRSLDDMLRERAAAGSGILLATHVLSHAERLAHRVGVLVEGRLAAEGTPEDILRRTGAKDLEEAFVAVVRGSGPVSAADRS